MTTPTSTPMPALDFGLVIHPTPRGGSVPEMLATNELLLAAAVEHDLSAWFLDHFQFDAQPFIECFALLAHTAGRFPSLRTGTLVLGQGYRNPALTAKIASSLHFLTDGRFTLGIGAGWKADEYRAYGYPFPPARQRIAELEEAVQIIRALWADGPASFSGRYYRIEQAYNEPRLQPPPTLMIGGGGERYTLPVVARHADWWNADYYAPADYARKLAILRRHCAAISRDPASITPTYYAGVIVSHDPDRTKGPPIRYRPDMHVLIGDPDQVAEQMAEFAAIGVRLMMLNFLDFPKPDSLTLFLNEVLPSFRRA